MNSQPEIIAVKNLSKSFNGKLAVAHIDLTVKKGEIFGFLGPNGGGKTTTIRMLCGLLTPDTCNGQCLGFDILRQATHIKEQVGYMTQKFSLYEELTIRENLDFMARLYNIKDHQKIIDQIIEDFNWQERKNQIVKTLSGGWKQRLALTAATLHNPQLLLLDEPTAGVDPQARREFWEHIHNLAASGTTVLVSTHYMDEAERCHRLAYISRGKIIARGTKEEIIAQAGICTFAVSGENINQLASTLKNQHDIEQITTLGNTLHINGKNATLLQEILQTLPTETYNWQQITPSLEDVFINLGKQHVNN